MRRWKVAFILLAMLVLSGIEINGLLLAKEGDQFVSADNPNILYTGRMDFSNPKAPSFDWPGVSILIRFTGTRCSVRLSDFLNEYNILVDGKFQSILKVESGQRDYPLVQGLSDGEHTLALVKRTEGSYGTAIFEGFILDAEAKVLTPPARLGRKIEWIGDSFTCGYGNEGKSPEDRNLRDRENCDLAFGPLTSRALNAEYHIVAISGKGMIRNYGDPKRFSVDPMPSYFDRTCQNKPDSKWDFGRWTPDAVVITLGFNDFSTPPQPNIKDYTDAYKELISKIRNFYPQTHIFCLSFYGMPGLEIKGVVESFNQSGDNKIHYYEDNRRSSINELGSDYHPKVSVHEKLAHDLSVYMGRIMEWS